MDEGYPFNRHDSAAAGDIVAALDALLASDALRLSDRNRRFLSFVVQQAIAGRSDRIKAYTIGVDVFGRDDGFDPSVDPIVRIEATRLRSALNAYYEGAGVTDRIRISIPRGGYVPTFSTVRSTRPEPAALPPKFVRYVAGVDPTTIVIQDHSAQSDPDAQLQGEFLTDVLLVLLRKAQYRTLVNPPAERRAASGAIEKVFAQPGEAYFLAIAVRLIGQSRRYSWRLSDLRSGEVVASAFEDHLAGSPAYLDTIGLFAEAIISAIGSTLACD